jgi:NTE family protein
LLAPPTGEFAEAALAGTLEELSHAYANVLLLIRPRAEVQQPPPDLLARRTVRLADASASLPASAAGRAGHTVRAWTTPGKHWRPDDDGVVHVPPLAADDEQSLAEGLLASSSAAGKALGWVARDLCGLKVGLALGAGSVRGYAHYGVLRVFERIGLVADYVTGTSIGAIVASTYALGQSADEAARTMESTSMRAFRLTVPVHSLLSNAGISANFRQVSGDTRIEDLDVPLALVAADLTTGREVILQRGLLRLAALASMAIPGIYPPLRMGRHVLVDGGIVNPVPISVATAMGADVVIAVNLGRSAREPLTDVEATEEKQARLPSLLQAITRSVEVMQGRVGAESTAAATVLIEPTFAAGTGLGLQSFHQGRPYIAPGEDAAQAALPRIAASLPWLRV